MSAYDFEESLRRTVTPNTSNQNDEESIFLSSSSDDQEDDSTFNKKATTSSNRYSKLNDRDDYDEIIESDEDEDEERYQESENEDQYGYDYQEDDLKNRKPIKVYDEYDPENIDNDELDEVEFGENQEKRRYKTVVSNYLDPVSSDSDGDLIEENPGFKNYDKKNDDTANGKKLKAEKIKDGKYVSKQIKKTGSNKSDNSLEKKSQEVYAKLQEKKCKKSDELNIHSPPISPEEMKLHKKDDSKKIKNSKPSKKEPVLSNPSADYKIKKNNKEDQTAVISGRIINLSSGFKIPKRPSNESSVALASPIGPPEKKAKISKESEVEKKSIANSKTSSIQMSLNDSNKSTINIKKTSKKNEKSPLSPTKTSPVSNILKTVTPNQTKSHKAQKKKEDFQESQAFMEALGSGRITNHTKSSNIILNNNKQKKSIEYNSNNNNNNNNNNNYGNIEPKSTQAKLNNEHNFIQCATANSLIIDKSDQTEFKNVNHNSGDNNGYLSNNATITCKSNLSEPCIIKKDGVIKKRVTWADIHSNKDLINVQIFYLDESEKDIKRLAFKGGDMAKIEKIHEKEMRFQMTPSVNEYSDQENLISISNSTNQSTNWPSLVLIDLPDSIVIPEIKSLEKDVQTKREQTTLAVFVFKQFLPDSPSEPNEGDISSTDLPQTRLIPLEDITLRQQENEIQNNFSIADSLNFKANDNQILSIDENKNKTFYSPQHHQQQKRQQQQEQHQKNIVELDSSTRKNVKEISTPTTTILNEKDKSKVINIASTLIKSDEQAENLKKILNTIQLSPDLNKSINNVDNTDITIASLNNLINATKSVVINNSCSTLNSTTSSNVTIDNKQTKQKINQSKWTDAPTNSTFFSNSDTSSSWSTNFNKNESRNRPGVNDYINNSNPTSSSSWQSKQNTNQKNSSNSSVSFFKNNNDSNENSNEGKNDKHTSFGNLNNGRNVFVNSHKRGMGNRSSNSFSSGRTNFNNSNNYNNSNFKANNKSGFNTNNNKNSNNNRNYNKNINNSNRNRYNQHQQGNKSYTNKNDDSELRQVEKNESINKNSPSQSSSNSTKGGIWI